MIEDKVLHKSDPYGKHKEITSGCQDHENKENTVFMCMKEYGETFIPSPIHIMKKALHIKIPSCAPHIIKKVVYVHQNAGKETHKGIQERFKNEIKDYTASQGSNSVIL